MQRFPADRHYCSGECLLTARRPHFTCLHRRAPASSCWIQTKLFLQAQRNERTSTQSLAHKIGHSSIVFHNWSSYKECLIQPDSNWRKLKRSQIQSARKGVFSEMERGFKTGVAQHS